MRRTPLFQQHADLGARMVDFAGWQMPVQYSGVLDEHRAVRSAAGIFDLSHMGELIVTGVQALNGLQAVTTNDLTHLAQGQVQYTLLCRPDGGIIDDVLIYRLDAGYMIVANAANVEKDARWLAEHLPAGAHLENRSGETALVAVQGPLAGKILQAVTPVNLATLYGFECVNGTVADVDTLISRTGYTGEDGFELYVRSFQAQAVWNALMRVGKPLGMVPVGLGARDTLRLEARLPLYGNDIDETTTPLEAGLGFFVRLSKGEFMGREALLRQKEAGVTRRLVAFMVEGRGIPRKGYPLLAPAGQEIGVVTSGSFSPTLGRDIGMGYVAMEYAEPGSGIQVSVRGKARPAEVIKGRFVPSNVRRRP